ncbi:hypothetical protein GRZ55_11440 [Chelativorans sp. ZYF759]|uniref:hypothetical protein n=1 Tax=Chelativorans sp. ZYF759 TaxID=2692213 RepID=UPI00145D0CD9|nr:hypothetical protein [Chelativorans sp. ZYF759]NMG39858.1 hypothetical protein [Chelativorans sp. ZYF759]
MHDDPTLARLLLAAKDVVDAISFDVNGIALPTGFQGGNGGLVSQETIRKSDELRRAIAGMTSALQASAGASADVDHPLRSEAGRDSATTEAVDKGD